MENTKEQILVEEIKKITDATSVPHVETVTDYLTAYATNKILKTKRSNYEILRKRWTKPLLDQKKLIDNDFKNAMHPLEQLIKNIEDVLREFAIAEEARKQFALQEATKDLNEKKRIAMNPKDINDVLDVSKAAGELAKVREEANTREIGRREHWTYLIVDEYSIPREYCSPDSKKINQAIKDGERTIDGLDIYKAINIV